MNIYGKRVPYYYYHIVVETVEGNLSLGMRQLNGVYTQFNNRSRQRVGHVFRKESKSTT
jgi:hypothetical protein